MGGGVSSYLVEGEPSTEVANKLRTLSDKLLGNGKFNVLDLEATKHMLQYCKEIKFRQDAVDDNAEGRALSLLLKSILYHSKALGISNVEVGDRLAPFKLDNLTFPRMSQPRPSTQTMTSQIDWQQSSASGEVPPVTADYLFNFPSFSGADSFWIRFDSYLHFLKRAGEEINTVVQSSGLTDVHFQVKDLNGTLDKLIYRSKQGTDLLRCRYQDVDGLKSVLESSMGFQCVEDGQNAIGCRVLKLCRTVSYHDLANVPIWIEVAHGDTVTNEELENVTVTMPGTNPMETMNAETIQHVAYEVERMQAQYDISHLQQMAYSFEALEVELVSFQSLQDAKPIVRSRLLMQMDQQQAMLAAKYGGTCS